MTIALFVLAVALLALAYWGFDQRQKRMDAEADLDIERLRNGLLHEQVPYPFVDRRLP